MGNSRWVLAIRAGMPEGDLMTQTPQLVKVCTPDFVRELVKRALPGMPLTHLPIPPPAISTRVETQYFGISRTGPCWNRMLQTRQVGVYVPNAFPNPELQVLGSARQPTLWITYYVAFGRYPQTRESGAPVSGCSYRQSSACVPTARA